MERLACIGIADNAFLCFSSYLSDRKQFVQIKNIQSDSVSVTHGIPQGSVLGPLLFIIYILPLGRINFHFYADDTQVYISTRPNVSYPLSDLTKCLQDINIWMTNIFLSEILTKQKPFLWVLDLFYLKLNPLPYLLIIAQSIFLPR